MQSVEDKRKKHHGGQTVTEVRQLSKHRKNCHGSSIAFHSRTVKKLSQALHESIVAIILSATEGTRYKSGAITVAFLFNRLKRFHSPGGENCLSKRQVTSRNHYVEITGNKWRRNTLVSNFHSRTDDDELHAYNECNTPRSRMSLHNMLTSTLCHAALRHANCIHFRR